MKGRAVRRRLHLEELEGRLVPSATVSTNWSGYAVAASRGAVTSVIGSWVVPTVSGTGTAYSSAWVGIDGFNSSSVEQIGTDSDVSNGVPQYYAWFEMYPNPSYVLPLAVHPGDTITAKVSYANSRFTLQITDANDPAATQTDTITRSARAARSSAEWIQEAPSSYTGVLPLANFGTITFSGAQATLGGTTGAIDNASWASKVDSINMVTPSGATKATTSALTDTGSPASSRFTVTFVSSGAGRSSVGGSSRQSDQTVPQPSSTASGTPSLVSGALRSAATQVTVTVPTSVAAALGIGSAFTAGQAPAGSPMPSTFFTSGSSVSPAGPAPTAGVASTAALLSGAADEDALPETSLPPADLGTPAVPPAPGSHPSSRLPLEPASESGAAAEARPDTAVLFEAGDEGEIARHAQDLVFAALALGGSWGIAPEHRRARQRLPLAI
jgi:hypothetical protein